MNKSCCFLVCWHAVFHSYEFPRCEQSLWSNGIVGVSSSNCTVANRSRSWTRAVAFSFIGTAPSRGKLVMEFFGLSQSIPLYLSSILPAQHCALKLPNPEQTYDLLCLWRHHRSIKRSWMFGLSMHIFSPNFHDALLVQSACCEVFPGVFSQNWARKDFRSWGSLFLDDASQIAHFFPEFNFVPGSSWEFLVCPAITILQLSVQQNSLDLNFEIHHLERFFLRIATYPWLLCSRPQAEVALTITLSTWATSTCFPDL